MASADDHPGIGDLECHASAPERRVVCDQPALALRLL